MTASASSAKTLAHRSSTATSLSSENKFILNCLVAGFTQAQIARSMGITDSAVSQAVSTYNLDELAIGLRVSRQALATETDDLIGRIENKALKQLDLVVGSVADPVKLARVAATLNGMKRRSQLEERQGAQDGGKVATIVMPVQVIQSLFKFNERNQAVEIDGRTLVATTGDALMKELGAKPAILPRSEDFLHQPTGVQQNVPDQKSARTETSGRATSLPGNFFYSNPEGAPVECYADLL